MQLMTIHQAKGLQFKAVFVFSAHNKHESKGFAKSSISIDRDLGITTKFPKDEDYFSSFEEPPHFKVMKFISGKKADAEADRLMYVALTRPKNYLFVSGEMKLSKANPDGSIPEESPLGKICEHLHIDYTSDSHPCTGSLQVLEGEEDGEYLNTTKNITFSIPIIHTLPVVEAASVEDEKAPLNFIVNTQPIPDTTISPVISATQYVTYMQCPMKYHLRYRLHLDDLIPAPKRNYSTIPESAEAAYDESSDDSKSGDIPDSEELLAKGFAEKRGIVIHSLLEKEVPIEQIESTMEMLLAGMPELKADNKEFSKIAETYASFINSKNVYGHYQSRRSTKGI